MRYHFEKQEFSASQYGQIYICDHSVYSRCTLYRIEKKSLVVIKQRFDPVGRNRLLAGGSDLSPRRIPKDICRALRAE